MRTRRRGLVGMGLLVSLTTVGLAAPIEDLIGTIKSVGKEGQGNEGAMRAVRELSGGSATTLLPLLRGMDDANPVAANWLRGVFETIADREVKTRGELPARELESFVVETRHDPHARRLAYEWLLKVDPTASERLIPEMLRDPGAEFRRDAVQRLIEQATERQGKEEKEAAIRLYRLALEGATDDDQVQGIVKPLKELGETVDLQKHFGFVVEWKLIGPFDNHDLVGFDAVYPPEERLDFGGRYTGKDGREVSWIDFRTADDYGVVDLRTALGPYKGAVIYAAAHFAVDSERSVEIRLGTPNAWKLWVNGKLAFARDEYHRGTQMDQYRVPVKFKGGRNTFLLKVCQNEQTEDWAQDWKFQLRVSDSSGAAVKPSDD